MKEFLILKSGRNNINFLCTLVVFIKILNCQSIEIVEENGCSDTEFRLTCRQLDSLIAVLDAVFESRNNRTNLTGSSCPEYRKVRRMNDGIKMADIPQNGESLREPLNNRCSGKNHCSFKMYEDYINSRQMGRGLIKITYACMPDRLISRYCGANINLSRGPHQGFVLTPRYPAYYIGTTQCSWNITTGEGLRVEITLLDVSLRGVPTDEIICRDGIIVTDNAAGRVLLDTCEPSETSSPKTLQSEKNEGLIVTLVARSTILFPKRGALLYYRSIGCVKPELPQGVAIVNQYEAHSHGGDYVDTDLHVVYMCISRGHVFPDSRTPNRTVVCYRGRQWNNTLPNCINTTGSPFHKNVTLFYDNREAMTSDKTDVVYDVIVPLLLIAVLFIGNAFIVFVIFRYRKRKQAEQNAEEQEVLKGALTLSLNDDNIH